MKDTMNQIKKRVFIADDDLDILDAVEIVLSDEGLLVETTTRGDDALTHEPLPDLFLLDIWMSGQDGKEICLALKKNERTKHIPVILFSANKDTEQIAHSAGADDYLLKPFDIDELTNKINALL